MDRWTDRQTDRQTNKTKLNLHDAWILQLQLDKASPFVPVMLDAMIPNPDVIPVACAAAVDTSSADASANAVVSVVVDVVDSAVTVIDAESVSVIFIAVSAGL